MCMAGISWLQSPEGFLQLSCSGTTCDSLAQPRGFGTPHRAQSHSRNQLLRVVLSGPMFLLLLPPLAGFQNALFLCALCFRD